MKLHVGLNKPSHPGWIHVKTFGEFRSLLSKHNIKDIEIINFCSELEDEEEDLIYFDGSDCAVFLIQSSEGHRLPCCITEDKRIKESLDHYTKSYKYDNYCGYIVKTA